MTLRFVAFGLCRVLTRCVGVVDAQVFIFALRCQCKYSTEGEYRPTSLGQRASGGYGRTTRCSAQVLIALDSSVDNGRLTRNFLKQTTVNREQRQSSLDRDFVL